MRYQSTSILNVTRFTVDFILVTVFKEEKKKKKVLWKPCGYIKRALKNYSEHGQCIFREGRRKYEKKERFEEL